MRVLAALASLAFVAGGCGIGPGAGSAGSARLTVTRDYGHRLLIDRPLERPRESDTVLRALDREAKVRTSYGSRFVQGINGIEGLGRRGVGGRLVDWFFYVNGIESSSGAADVRIHPGDRVWWDYRDWSVAMRVPAVVGSWPEPFLHGSGGKRYPTRVDCLGESRPCSDVAGTLQRAGVPASVAAARARAGTDVIRVAVGPWGSVRQDDAARRIEDGPGASGVFANFEPTGSGGQRLELLDEHGRVRRTLGAGSGLVAAVSREGSQPIWLVTGTDPAGVTRAVRLLDARDLRDRYAVAVGPRGRIVPLPVR